MHHAVCGPKRLLHAWARARFAQLLSAQIQQKRYTPLAVLKIKDSGTAPGHMVFPWSASILSANQRQICFQAACFSMELSNWLALSHDTLCGRGWSWACGCARGCDCHNAKISLFCTSKSSLTPLFWFSALLRWMLEKNSEYLYKNKNCALCAEHFEDSQIRVSTVKKWGQRWSHKDNFVFNHWPRFSSSRKHSCYPCYILVQGHTECFRMCSSSLLSNLCQEWCRRLMHMEASMKI